MKKSENKDLFDATTLDISVYGKWSLADVLRNLNRGKVRDYDPTNSKNFHEIKEYLKSSRHYMVSQMPINCIREFVHAWAYCAFSGHIVHFQALFAHNSTY